MALVTDYMTEEELRIIIDKYQLDEERVREYLAEEEERGKPFYSCRKIDEQHATYNLIYGKRSNGKTFKICRKIIVKYLAYDLPSAYIRRLDEMIKQGNLQSLFKPHEEFITIMTGGTYNAVSYRVKCFNFCTYKDGIKIRQDKTPFCRSYAINTAETTKGQDAGEIALVCFDEFITRQFYLSQEFVLFQNILSSIIRTHSDKVKVYMLANSVSKYCPYFREMGLNRVKEQKQGTIDLYTMGKTETRIAVEYSGAEGAADKVSSYFCFDNPELEMITSGAWEIALYRHIPRGVGDQPPELQFYVIFDGQTMRGGLYIFKDAPLLTFSRRYKEIKDPEQQIIYSDTFDDPPDPNPLHQTQLNCTVTRAHELIISLIKQRKTYFDTNEDGEIISNWLKWATKGALKV